MYLSTFVRLCYSKLFPEDERLKELKKFDLTAE